VRRKTEKKNRRLSSAHPTWLEIKGSNLDPSNSCLL
jgi:hypothetical protein